MNELSGFAKISIIFIALSLISAIIVGFQRNGVESSNKNVEIAMDYNAFSDMAKTGGFEETFTAMIFKDSGLTSISFNEDTIVRMKQDGLLNFYYGSDLPSPLRPIVKEKYGQVSPDKIYITVFSNETARQIFTNLPMFKVPIEMDYSEKQKYSSQRPCIMETSVPEDVLLKLGVGFDKTKIDKFAQMGFDVILRPENKLNINADMINSYMGLLASYTKNASIIFTGAENDALGYPNYLNETAESIKKENFTFGIIEAPNAKSMQKGINTLAGKCPDQALRVMSIPPAQQLKLTIEDIVGKYSLGIRERNMRIIYIRPYTTLKDNQDILQTNVAYIKAIKDQIQKNGFKIGKAAPFKKYSPAIVLLIILGLGAIAILALLLEKLGLSPALQALMFVLWVIFTVVALITGKELLWKQITALIAALTVPILALKLNFNAIKEMMYDMDYKTALIKGSTLLAQIFGVCVGGGLIVAAILSSNEFLTQAQQFRGIKLLLILPLIITLLLWLADEQKLMPAIKEMLSKAVNFAHILILGFIGGAGTYHILRSGNVGESSVTGTEMSLRNTLAGIFSVRPRFKEFLLGFPAIMLFPALFILKLEKYSWVLIGCATIGACDIIDTFIHLHTPIGVTLTRVILGLILGWIVGAVVLGLVYLYDKKFIKLNLSR